MTTTTTTTTTTPQDLPNCVIAQLISMQVEIAKMTLSIAPNERNLSVCTAHITDNVQTLLRTYYGEKLQEGNPPEPNPPEPQKATHLHEITRLQSAFYQMEAKLLALRAIQLNDGRALDVLAETRAIFDAATNDAPKFKNTINSKNPHTLFLQTETWEGIFLVWVPSGTHINICDNRSDTRFVHHQLSCDDTPAHDLLYVDECAQNRERCILFVTREQCRNKTAVDFLYFLRRATNAVVWRDDVQRFQVVKSRYEDRGDLAARLSNPSL